MSAERSRGVAWMLAWRRFRRDRLGFVSLIVVLVYVLIMVGTATGLLVPDWEREAGVSYAPPSFLGPGSTAETGPGLPLKLPVPTRTTASRIRWRAISPRSPRV